MALYIFSDAHLGATSRGDEPEKLEKIIQLFELVKADADRLIILGDLFDFWFEYKHAIPKDHHKVLFMLTDLIERGIEIDYVMGNHDFWMDDFFEKQIGIRMHPEEFEFEYDGKRLHLIHGDGLAPGDRGYRFLKRILRNRFNIWLYRKLPPDWAIPLAKAVSGSSQNYTAGRDKAFAADYAAYAERKLADGFDIVAVGHLHLPTLTHFDTGIYVNTGEFIKTFSYVKRSGGELKLEYLK